MRGYAAVINGGRLVTPRLARRLQDSGGREILAFPPLSGPKVLSEATSREMRRILARVVAEGTATAAAQEGLAVGGKTGTARKLEDGQYSREKFVALFVGFAPADEPRFLALVLLDEPQGSPYGGVVAAPAAGAILKRCAEYRRIPPAAPATGRPGAGDGALAAGPRGEGAD